MLTSGNRQVYLFNKRGDKYGVMDLPPLYYLETEKEWINKRIDRSPMDGMAFLVDWDKKELTSIRYALD